MTVQTIIEESINKNPLGVKEALISELMSRISNVLEAKKKKMEDDTCMSEESEELDEAKERTPGYKFTVPIIDGKVHPDHQDKVDALKKEISKHNAENDNKKRIVMQGRMGKDNPNAEKYKTGGWGAYQRIAIKDASHADVYMSDRSGDDGYERTKKVPTEKPAPKKVDTTVYGRKHYAKVEK